MREITPGEVVVQEFGSAYQLAALLGEHFPGLGRSTVWRWAQPRAAGGTGGVIPSRYHLPLLRLAREHGRNLSADDLIFGRNGG